MKKHYRTSHLQEDILRETSRQIQSKSTLRKILKKHYADVNDAVDILQETGLIKQKGERQGRGHKEKFYVLTDKGIEKLINLKISIVDFWRMIFFIFDENMKYKSMITLNKIFFEYQQNVLLLPPKNAPFFFEEILDNTEYHETQMPDSDFKKVIEIIELLGYDGPQTINHISEKLKWVKSEKEFYLLERRGLITKSDSNKDVKYRLSHPGLLLLVDKIWDPIRLNKVNPQRIIYKIITDSNGKKWRVLKSKYNEGVELHELKKKINLLVKNHRYLLPKIFDNWQKLRVIKDEIALISIFRRLYFPSKTHEITLGSVTLKAQLLPSHKDTSRPIQIGGVREIFDIQRSMEIVYREGMRNMFSEGIRVLESWLKENGISHSFDPYQMLRKLNEDAGTKATEIRKQSLMNSKSVENGKIQVEIGNMVINRIPQIIQKLIELDEISEYRMTHEHYDTLNLEPRSNRIKTTENALENIITFQFYTFFGPLLKSEEGFLLLEDLKLREWYLEWMEQITEFNKNNLDIIKENKDRLVM